MTTNNDVIREFLRDPLLVEKNYIKEGESETINLGARSSVKMIELIKTVVTNNDSESALTRRVNQLLNLM